jgi:hypothetical protein
MPLRPKANGRGSALGGGNAAFAVIDRRKRSYSCRPKADDAVVVSICDLGWL